MISIVILTVITITITIIVVSAIVNTVTIIQSLLCRSKSIGKVQSTAGYPVAAAL